MENEQLYRFLKSYLSLEGYQFNAQELKIQLLGHPSYPSLHSLTGVLTHFGIDNVAAQLDVTAEILQQLPDRFLCTLHNASNLFMVSKQKEGLQISDFDRDTMTFSTEEFLKSWSGIAVLLSDEQDYESAAIPGSFLIKFRYLIFLFIFCVVFFIQGPTWQLSSYFLLSLMGLAISYLIVKQELGDGSPLLKKICGNESENGCSAVLDSDGSVLFKYVKLSDLSGMFFMGVSLLSIAQLYIPSNFLPFLSLVSLLALPITLYSLYYQGSVLKKWCRLCLMIVGVLWLQSMVLYGVPRLFLDSNLTFNQTFPILFLVFLGAFSWYVLQNSLAQSKELSSVKMMSNKFRNNFNVFNALLQQNTPIQTDIQDKETPELIFGRPNAPLNLLLITNPLCQYCKQAHAEAEALYLNNKEDIKLTIRFNVATSALESDAYRVSKRVLELYQNNLDSAFEALSEIFGTKAPLGAWLKKWGEPKEECSDLHRLLEQQRNWCFNNGYDFTPALLINGRKYPDEYQREELKFFVDELVETMESVTTF